MELKLTTKRALEYEAKTGQDLIAKMSEIADSGTVKVKDVVDIFAALGEGNTVEVFDAWDATFAEKTEKIFTAVKVFVQGNASPAKKRKAI